MISPIKYEVGVGRGCIAIIIVRRVELCDSGWAVAAGEYVQRYLSILSCFPGSDGVASSIRNSFFLSRKKKVIMYVRYVLEIGE